MMRCFGSMGCHQPQNGPQNPKTQREWDWSDRSCKQSDTLHHADDIVATRSTMPTPLEITRLVYYFQGHEKPELLATLQTVLTYWGQPMVENDTKLLLKAVLEGHPYLPRVPGMPANKGTSEFTLAKGLLAISRYYQPTDEQELCFCFPVTSVGMSGCFHAPMKGPFELHTADLNAHFCNSCSFCLRCKKFQG